MIEIRHQNMSTSENIKDAYNDIYQGKGIVRRSSYFLWLLELLKVTEGQLLVDISCGQGQLVDFAQKMGLRAIGFDFSYEGIKKAKNLNSMAGWFVSDGEKSGLANHCADRITHIGSLEHYQNIENGIKEIARLLKYNGIACILVPNTYSLFGNILYAAKHGNAFDDGQPLQRYNTNLGWKNILETNGLHVIKTIKYEIAPPRTQKDFLWLLIHPKKIIRLIISTILPVNLANSFIYLCKVKENL